MNCTEAQTLLGDLLDGHLDAERKSAFLAHAGLCVACRTSYELEAVAKAVIQNRVPRIPTPIEARRAVLSALRAEADRAARPWWVRVLRSVPAPAYGIAAVAAVVVYLVLPGDQATLDDMIRHSADNDIMAQTVANFAHIRDGSLKPTVVTCSPENVYGYLAAQRLPFEALVRPMERCDGYSARVDEDRGVRVAHVVYTFGDDLLYIYQVRRDDALVDRAAFTVPPAAREAVTATGWYTDPQHPQCNVVVWEESGTLCAATSTMDKEKMLALLATR